MLAATPNISVTATTTSITTHTILKVLIYLLKFVNLRHTEIQNWVIILSSLLIIIISF